MKLEITHGLRSGLAVCTKRPGDVRNIGYSRDVASEVTGLPKGLKPQGMTDRDLEKIAQTPHHEGFVVEAVPRKWTSPGELGDLLTKSKGTAIALDRVRNPYNVGAIIRSAAFFGIDAVIVGPTAGPTLDAQAVRVAEGGAEHVLLCRTTDLADSLARLRSKGVSIYGADGRSSAKAIGFGFERPAVLVLGNEREGLAERVRATCDEILAIEGTGAVESLNVAIAASVLISELTR